MLLARCRGKEHKEENFRGIGIPSWTRARRRTRASRRTIFSARIEPIGSKRREVSKYPSANGGRGRRGVGCCLTGFNGRRSLRRSYRWVKSGGTTQGQSAPPVHASSRIRPSAALLKRLHQCNVAGEINSEAEKSKGGGKKEDADRPLCSSALTNPPEEGEDIFFDSLDYLSASFRSVPSEETSTRKSEIEFKNFGCEVWTSELRSIRERRESFLYKMGFAELVPSDSRCSQGTRQECCGGSLQQPELGRIRENGDAVLDSSASGSERKEGDGHFVRDLDRDKFELGQDRQSSMSQREVDSTGGMKWDEFGMSHGLSHSVQQLVQKENLGCEGRHGGGISTRQKTFKSGWWKDLLRMRQSGEFSECNLSVHDAEEHKAGTTKMRRHGKSCTEFAALNVDQEFQAHKGSIWTMKFSPDGRYLATGGEDCVVRVWRVVEMETSCKVLSANLGKVKEFKLIPKSRCFDLGMVVIPRKAFKLEETPLHEFHGHTSDVLAFSWSKSNCLLTSSKDKTVRLWQVGLDFCLGVFRHNNYVTCVQFNPADDGYFISGSIDGKVRIWRISESRVVDWVDIRDIITAVCFRSNGQGFVVGSITGSCRFYYLSGNGLQLDAELNIQGKKKVSSKRITGFQFTPEDPERLMITSADSKVRIVHGSDVIHKYGGRRKSKSQLSASFTSDGRYIVSTGDDSRVYIWNYHSDALSSKATKSTHSCEYFFSKDASIAIPWPGMDNQVPGSSLQSQKILEPLACVRESERSCLGSWFFADCSTRPSATWPEEKLGLWGEDAGAINVSPRGGYGDHQHDLKLFSPAAWSRVIVTAGHDGIIRSFHNWGVAN
ncbi:hypothetical protein Taro_038465 [Colocasia esculenta]|uniref:WD repeat-containing protein 44 n=1 Tax=Colocasia esculenta TaxID=4460 RepID=A0A843W6R8_COLES|nr:hypothetical protein [Colocasia esculenta]